MPFSNVNSILTTLLFLILSGCSSTGYLPPSGDSLNTLTRLQTARQVPATAPLASTATLDGEQGAAVIEAFRTAIAKPAEINNAITVNVGN